MKCSSRITFALCLTLTAATSATASQRATGLADVVAGVYHGAITQALQGGSRAGVTCVVTSVAPSAVEVGCDDPRVARVRIPLARYGGSIQNAGGRSTFLVETSRDPRRLDLSIGGITLMVRR